MAGVPPSDEVAASTTPVRCAGCGARHEVRWTTGTWRCGDCGATMFITSTHTHATIDEPEGLLGQDTSE